MWSTEKDTRYKDTKSFSQKANDAARRLPNKLPRGTCMHFAGHELNPEKAMK